MRLIHWLATLTLLLAPVALAQEGGDTAGSDDGDKADVGKAALELGDPNIDPPMSCTIKMVDGKSHSGNVTHIFKGADWYGNDPEKGTAFEIKADVNLAYMDWKDVSSVSVGRPNTSSEMDCYSDEDKDPILWECTLKQPAAVRMKSKHEFSGSYMFNSKETYTFVFDNDASTAVTLRLYKLVANTQHYDSMSEALSRLQGELKDQNAHGVSSITCK